MLGKVCNGLYHKIRRNGVTAFPSTTIVVIHLIEGEYSSQRWHRQYPS